MKELSRHRETPLVHLVARQVWMDRGRRNPTMGQDSSAPVTKRSWNPVPFQFYTFRLFAPARTRSRSSEEESRDDQDLYEVRIIDNDHNTYGEVMQITMQALEISEEMAFAIAWEVDHTGSCAVAQGPYADAEAIAQIIRTIGIEVQVNPIVGSTC